PGPRSAKMRPATRTERGIHRRKCRWDAIATEHAGAGELGAGGADVDDATLANAVFHSRLDKLLESAIEEQEREQQGFLTVLQASRDAVDAVRSELDGVRSFIEHREQAAIALPAGRLALAARQDTIEFLQHRIELLEGEQAALKKALTVKLDGIARSLEAVEWRTQEGMAALANRVGGLESTVAAYAQSVAERLGAVDHRDGDLAATTVA